MNRLFYLIILVALFAACHKDKNEDGATGKRITNIAQTNTSNWVYSYDAQGRLQRIAPSPSYYILVEYMPNGMVMKSYNASNVEQLPRYEFNIPDDKVIYCKAVLPNNKTKNNSYTYDAGGRLTQQNVFEYKTSTNEKKSDYITYFSYSGNNVNRVLYLSTYVDTYDDHMRNDSIIIELEYYTDKKHFTWSDLGINCFGTANTAADMLQSGQLYSPLPAEYYVTPEGMLPTGNPVKKRSKREYRWNQGTKKWALFSTNSTTFPETDYANDAEGRLIKWAPWLVNLEWKQLLLF